MSSQSFIIGIGGGTGSGKTTIMTDVIDAVETEITTISLDNYYRDRSDIPPQERKRINYDHPRAIEWELFLTDLQKINQGKPIQSPQYDFNTHTRNPETVRIDPAPVVVVEGIFALYNQEVLNLIELPIYVETDPDVRILRRIQRDVVERDRSLEGVIDQYLTNIKPMHKKFVEPTKKNADIIIPEGSNKTAVELLRDKIELEISESGEY